MIKIENLSVLKDKKTIIDSLNLDIEEGLVHVVVGENGSGKTTLIQATCGLLKYEGNIIVDTLNLNQITKKSRASLIALNPQIKEMVNMTVIDFLYLSRYHERGIFKSYTSSDEKIIDEAITITNIEAYKNRLISTLSGGEAQRVFLASTIAQDSKYIFFDEPTTYLDINNTKEFFKIISKLKNIGKTIILVLHDINQTIKIADDIILLENGKLIAKLNKNEMIDSGLIEKHFKLEKKVFQNESETLTIFE